MGKFLALIEKLHHISRRSTKSSTRTLFAPHKQIIGGDDATGGIVR
jgi:hypothetical protein